MRATNLQELVYKNGQAGITKATVSITFDNRDADQCPFGYSHYDEIVVTRQVSSISLTYMQTFALSGYLQHDQNTPLNRMIGLKINL